MDEQDRLRHERDKAIEQEDVTASASQGGGPAVPGGETEDLTGGRREWNRREWSGEAGGESEPPRWNKNQWAGEAADPTDEQPGGHMPAGEGGPQGLGHNPGEQHWVPEREERKP